MTPGIDKTTLDGISLEKTFGTIIEAMRTETFQFNRGKRTYIPKASGSGMRPITIAPPREKIVQEVMRMILDAIFDSEKGPTFLESSHGFRRGKGTHSALETIRKNWGGTRWFIEGDIKGCFDNIDHHILMKLLRRRIKDERFLNLIWKALRAGYMEGLKGFDQDIGSPQGSIVSPILANIYLHELDLFVEGLRSNLETEKARQPNPVYRRLQRQKGVAEKKGDITTVALLAQKMRDIPSFDAHDPAFARVRYLRYADDWIIGLVGSNALAIQLKEQIKVFLQEELKLTLSEEKTHIRHAGTEQAKFLGTLISIQGGGNAEAKVVTVTRNGSKFRKRVTGWLPKMKMPVDDLIKRLHSKGFCTVEGEPVGKVAWVNLTHEDILLRYSATLRGLANYYGFADNYSAITRIQYILQHSAAKTLATKFRLKSRSIVFRKFGRSLKAKTEVSENEVKETHLWLESDFRRKPNRFLGGDPPKPLNEIWIKRLTRSHLGSSCCICNASNGIQMHHVRHVRKAGHKPKGFHKVMGLINRKQIPVCLECHGKIHKGEYDGLELGQFAYNPAKPKRVMIS